MATGAVPGHPFRNTDEQTVFWKLSALLTGSTELERDLSNRYYDLLKKEYGPELTRLCELYYDVQQPVAQQWIAALLQKIDQQQPADRDALHHAARQIVRIWYVSEYDGSKGSKQVAGARERGLLWRLIKAHPPSYSTNPYGYWQQPPQ